MCITLKGKVSYSESTIKINIGSKMTKFETHVAKQSRDMQSVASVIANIIKLA